MNSFDRTIEVTFAGIERSDDNKIHILYTPIQDQVLKAGATYDVVLEVCPIQTRASKSKTFTQQYPNYFKYVGRLNSRLARVFELRLRGRSCDSIGREFNVTHERIRQLEKEAIRRLTWYCSREDTPHTKGC